MFRIDPQNYHNFIDWAGTVTSNQVYPCSIAEGFQTGQIYADDLADPQTVLFWHYAGFAYLTGKIGDRILKEVSEKVRTGIDGRRFVLITDNEDAAEFFSGEEGISIEKRLEYVHTGVIDQGVSRQLPADCRIEPIHAANIDHIRGRIIPAFSWDGKEKFLENGFGYVISCQNEIAAVSFSAAVSSEEVDIGVETMENYRKQGFALLLTEQMCKTIHAQGKRPVWAHSQKNEISGKTALACGFTRIKENLVIRTIT